MHDQQITYLSSGATENAGVENAGVAAMVD